MKPFVMFQKVLLLTFVFTLSNSFAQSNEKKIKPADTTVDCLEFTGKLDASMKSAEGDYTVKLIRDNKVIEAQTIGVKKAFKFILKMNMFYTIRVEKEGFIPRLFSVSTTLPKNLAEGDIFKFHFETNLISSELYHQFDDDDMDFPLALISYGKSCECFEYDRKYTEKIMSRIISRLLNGA